MDYLRLRSLALSALVNGTMLVALLTAVSREEGRAFEDGDLETFDVIPAVVAEAPSMPMPAGAATSAPAPVGPTATFPSVPRMTGPTSDTIIAVAPPVVADPSVPTAVAHDVPVSNPSTAALVSVATPSASTVVQPAANVDDYARRVVAWLSRHKRFPQDLARRIDGGLVVVRFTLDSAGRARECDVVGSSGSAALDELAVEQVRSASPFPRPPRALDAPRAFEVPMRYRAT